MGILQDLGMERGEAPRSESRLKFTDVPHGPELHRILTAPTRPILDPESDEAAELAEFLTDRLARKPDPYPGRLLPIQAMALKEAWENRGLFAMLRVGAGKSLLAFLLPVVLEAKRPLYVCPAAMRPDILKEFAQYARDWQGSIPQVISYELIASPASAKDLDAKGQVERLPLLERIQPDLLILDESHKVSVSSSAAARRINEFVGNTGLPVAALTGTPFIRSVKDVPHILQWTVGDSVPFPVDYEEREMWASYLDPSTGMGAPAGLGALIEMLTPEERKQLRRMSSKEEKSFVRRAVARRLLQTPGVIGSQDPPVDIGLRIEGLKPQQEDPAVDAALAELHETWCLPDGTEVTDGLEFAAKVNTLGLGYWTRWDPAPPAEWREARNDWAKWARKLIKSNRRGIDTEARLMAALKKGLYDDEGRLARWIELRNAERKRTGLREPPSVPVWISNEALISIAEWLDEQQNGIVWVNSIPLGERAGRELGIPYYGEKGIDEATGRHIKNHPGGPAVASIKANGTGRNLQRLWHKNLWKCEPTEQALGRTHRVGQPEPVVLNWVYYGCTEHLDRFWRAVHHKAGWAEDMTLQPQKLKYAEKNVPKLSAVCGGEGRWKPKPRKE